MLIGTTLPQFGSAAAGVIGAARRAEEAGLDGVFLFDHLLAPGTDDRPVQALWPLLGAVSAATRDVQVGTLVARVGIFPDAYLAAQLVEANDLCQGRLVAGLGVGDRLSAGENRAMGITPEPVERRVERLVSVAEQLLQRGVTVWIGGRHRLLRQAARDLGVPLNLWASTPAELHEAAEGNDVTWAGPVLVGEDEADAKQIEARFGLRSGLLAGDVTSVAQELSSVRDSGASWAVLSPLDSASPSIASRLRRVRDALSASRGD